MAVTRSRAARGLAVLALAGAVAATALAGSVTAAPKAATKKYVNKQIKKAVNNLSSNVIHQPVFYRQSAQIVVAPGSYDEGFVACPPGTSALGGGVAPQKVAGFEEYVDAEIEASHPSNGTSINAGTTGWAAGFENLTGSPANFRVYVICAAVQKDSTFAEGSPPARSTGSATREG